MTLGVLTWHVCGQWPSLGLSVSQEACPFCKGVLHRRKQRIPVYALGNQDMSRSGLPMIGQVTF